jgi:DNA helicase-2/ATP-dependent DNA helicase PcrA
MLHGQIRYNTKSRFLNELPDENIKWLSPQQRGWFATPKSAWDSDGNFSPSFNSKPKINNPSHHNITVTTEHGWSTGQNVQHAKFGEGVITKIEGSGTNCRAHIQFHKLGLKVLDLNVAKLERV